MQVDDARVDERAIVQAGNAEHGHGVEALEVQGQAVQAADAEERQVGRLAVEHHDPGLAPVGREATRAGRVGEALNGGGVPAIDQLEDLAEAADPRGAQRRRRNDLASGCRGCVDLSVNSVGHRQQQEQRSDERCPHFRNSFTQFGVSKARAMPAATYKRRSRSWVNTV